MFFSTIKDLLSFTKVRDLTPKLIKPISQFDSNNFIANRSKKKGNNLFSKLKTKSLISQISNVVYEIPCSNCELTYLGQISKIGIKDLS